MPRSHPALLLFDTVSSLAAVDYRHDEWGVDVTISGSQKSLLLPPGLLFSAVSKKAFAASKQARLPRSYWDWEGMLAANKSGFSPYTPNTNLLQAEGLDRVFARHARAAKSHHGIAERPHALVAGETS